MDSRSTLEDRIKAIEQLTQIFRTDRRQQLTQAVSCLHSLAGPANTFSQQPGPAILFTSAGEIVAGNNII
jgi:hypothetical protein